MAEAAAASSSVLALHFTGHIRDARCGSGLKGPYRCGLAIFSPGRLARPGHRRPFRTGGPKVRQRQPSLVIAKPYRGPGSLPGVRGPRQAVSWPSPADGEARLDGDRYLRMLARDSFAGNSPATITKGWRLMLRVDGRATYFPAWNKGTWNKAPETRAPEIRAPNCRTSTVHPNGLERRPGARNPPRSPASGGGAGSIAGTMGAGPHSGNAQSFLPPCARSGAQAVAERPIGYLTWSRTGARTCGSTHCHRRIARA